MSIIINEEWLVSKTATGGSVEHLRTPKFTIPIIVPNDGTMRAGEIKWRDTEPANVEQWLADAMKAFVKTPFPN